MHRLLLSFTLLALPLSAAAKEGMFLLDKLPAADLQRSGLKVPVAKLGELSQAVAQVAHGGSGSFVSKDGLLVTNHHVAYGCLVRLDSQKAHRGLLRNGYLAASRPQELSCPGYDLLVVERVEDVTQKIHRPFDWRHRRGFAAHHKAVHRAKEALRVACEKEQPGRVCEVAAMDGGRLYYLSIYKRIRDVRLVYAPPATLGKFGGDIDNWLFPRHTADFSFLRAYVDREGKGVPYAKANVPLSTPQHLVVSSQGVKRGSLVLVMGFPGRTSRHVSSHSVRFQQQFVMPELIALLDGALKVVQARAKKSPEARRKYAGLDARLNNGLKYFQMSKAGFAKWKLLDNKLTEERALAKDERFTKGDGPALFAEMGRIFARAQRNSQTYSTLRWLTRMVATARVAYDIVRWGREKALDDKARPDDRYKDKNVYAFKEAAQRLEQETERATEEALLAFFLRDARQLKGRQRIEALSWLLRWARKGRSKAESAAIAAGKLDEVAHAVKKMFDASKLLAARGDDKAVATARALRDKAFTLDKRKIAALKDPLLTFAAALDRQQKALRDGPFAEVEKYLGTVLRSRWVVAKGATYPDANFTVRLSYGSVQDYTATATGKLHSYMTDLAGVIAKDKGKAPFEVPASLRAAYKAGAGKSSRFRDAQIGDVPINFTCTLDTTGGNSGSAVLDDHGRLVGLLFDGTPESILSDWQYLHKEQRSIVVDIRYALFLAELQGAKALLEELGGARSKRRLR